MNLMIPRTIHYCWFGDAQKSDLNRRCLDSWRRVLPGYHVKEWNEKNSPLDSPYCQEAHRKGLWSRLSNNVRLQVLYSEGGIYLDTDVEVLKDFGPLLLDRCFLGFQQRSEDDDWVNSAVLGAQSAHPFIRSCLELTEALHAETGEFFRSPSIVTTVLRNMGLRSYGLQELNGIKIYPAEYFYPYPWFSSFSPECIKEATYCIHYWEGSWLKQREQNLPPNQRFKKLIFSVRRRMYTAGKRIKWARNEQLHDDDG